MNTAIVELSFLALVALLAITYRLRRNRKAKYLAVTMVNPECAVPTQVKLCKVLRPHADGTLHAYEQ